MASSEEFQIISVIWIALIPVSILGVAFTFLVVATNQSLRIRDAMVCSLLVSRLGHCAGVVLMICIFVIHGLRWTEQLCEVMLWMWITCFMADILTTVTSAGFHASRLGRKESWVECKVVTILLLIWVVAVVLGAFPFFTTGIFYNYQIRNGSHKRECMLGLTIDSNDHVHLGVNLFLVIAILFGMMFAIAILAETKRLLKGIKLSSSSTLNRPSESNPSECTGTFKKEIVPPHKNKMEIKDIKYTHYAAVYCTSLFNCGPQLIMYITDMQLPYSHEILVSAGLLHGIILPLLICSMGLRYRKQAKKLVCCRSTKDAKLERHEQISNIDVRQPRSQSRTGPTVTEERKMVDRSTSISIPGVTVTCSTDDTFDKIDNSEQISMEEKHMANGHVVSTEAQVNHTTSVCDHIEIKHVPSNNGFIYPRRSSSACIDRRDVVDLLPKVRRTQSSVSQNRQCDIIPEVEEDEPERIAHIEIQEKQEDKFKPKKPDRLPKQNSQDTVNSDATINIVKSKKQDDSYVASSFHHDNLDVCFVASVHDSASQNKADDNFTSNKSQSPHTLKVELPGVVRSYEESSYYDSDSEAWSNLYAESDIADILDVRPASPISERTIGHKRVPSDGSFTRTYSSPIGVSKLELKDSKRQVKSKSAKSRKNRIKKREELSVMSGLGHGAQFGFAVAMQIAKNKSDDSVPRKDLTDSRSSNKKANLLCSNSQSFVKESSVDSCESIEHVAENPENERQNVSNKQGVTKRDKPVRNNGNKRNAIFRKGSSTNSRDSDKQVRDNVNDSNMARRESARSVSNQSEVKRSSYNPFLTESNATLQPSEINPEAFLEALQTNNKSNSTNPFLNDLSYSQNSSQHESTADTSVTTVEVYATISRRGANDRAGNDVATARASNPFIQALDLPQQKSERQRKPKDRAQRASRSVAPNKSIAEYLNQRTVRQGVPDSGNSLTGEENDGFLL